MPIDYLVHSEAGHNHINEDALLVRRHPDASQLLLCSLADGQGGQFGGAVAAQVAVEESIKAASSFPPNELFCATSWYGIISAADETVSEAHAAGFTTLVSLCISEQEVCGASCGDSDALLISGSQELLLTENQRKHPPVGSSAAHPVAFSARLKPGWKLVVMSDGVWKYIEWEHIVRISAAKQGLELVATLRQAALDANGGKMEDDFSVALLQYAE